MDPLQILSAEDDCTVLEGKSSFGLELRDSLLRNMFQQLFFARIPRLACSLIAAGAQPCRSECRHGGWQEDRNARNEEYQGQEAADCFNASI